MVLVCHAANSDKQIKRALCSMFFDLDLDIYRAAVGPRCWTKSYGVSPPNKTPTQHHRCKHLYNSSSSSVKSDRNIIRIRFSFCICRSCSRLAILLLSDLVVGVVAVAAFDE